MVLGKQNVINEALAKGQTGKYYFQLFILAKKTY